MTARTQPTRRHRFTQAALAGLLLVCTLMPRVACAQVLMGPWVDENEMQIERVRKTSVTVVVLDQKDRAVQGAKVRLTQQRHDFLIGLTLPPSQEPPANLAQQQVYRVFNAVALDRYTDWTRSDQDITQTQRSEIQAWADAIKPIHTAYGRVVSADSAHNLDQLALYSPDRLRDALLARVQQACALSPRPDSYDLYADVLGQDMIERKLGRGIVHRLFESARASRTDAALNLRVRDAISLRRGRDLGEMIQRMQIRQVPLDGVTLEQRFSGQVQPLPLQRMLRDYVAKIDAPVTVAGLEVGGPSEVAAGLNLETVLRLLFAQPNVRGVYFAGLTAEYASEENSPLLNHKAQPTAAGLTLDALFTEHWRSDITDSTDERGNVQARVFTGWYTAHVTLPGGQTMSVQAYIPKSERTKLIVLQVTAAEVPEQQ